MDSEFWGLFFKIVVFLPFIIFLIYLSLKVGGTKLQSIQGNRYLKIIERLALSKDNSLMVVKVGRTAYVITSTNSKAEILRELSSEELTDLESSNSSPQYDSLKELLRKFKHKKEE